VEFHRLMTTNDAEQKKLRSCDAVGTPEPACGWSQTAGALLIDLRPTVDPSRDLHESRTKTSTEILPPGYKNPHTHYHLTLTLILSLILIWGFCLGEINAQSCPDTDMHINSLYFLSSLALHLHFHTQDPHVQNLSASCRPGVCLLQPLVPFTGNLSQCLFRF